MNTDPTIRVLTAVYQQPSGVTSFPSQAALIKEIKNAGDYFLDCAVLECVADLFVYTDMAEMEALPSLRATLHSPFL